MEMAILNSITSSGVPGLGDISWGTHFCHFYDSRSDLADTLVPFFKTGLENNEACLWVTCDPYSAAGARDELGAVVPDLAERERAGQIEIIDHDQWYRMHGRNNDARTTLQGWLDREAAALRHGFQGLRLTGNTYWLERGDWDSFMAYEQLVNQTFQKHRIIGLCSYCLSRCTPANVLDVVGTHQFALSRRRGVWEVVEGSSLKLAREDLVRLRASEQALRESDRRKDDFLAMLAHELRNPLAPIRSGLELLTPESPDQQELLNLIQRQLQHLVRLVDDLLDVSRIMRGRIELRRECIDLAAVIQHAIEAVRPQIDDHGQQIEVSLPEEPVWIDADQVRMTQVLQNVVHNASRHSEPGELIKIEVNGDEGDFVQIHVRDYGSGIEPEMLSRIFELFVQTECSLDRVGGWKRPNSGWSPPFELRWRATTKTVLPCIRNSPASGLRDAL
jgi:signal transduction histidine kinase